MRAAQRFEEIDRLIGGVLGEDPIAKPVGAAAVEASQAEEAEKPPQTRTNLVISNFQMSAFGRVFPDHKPAA